MSPACVVTIGIPTIGTSRYISDTVRSALEQLPNDGEIVISDNASADPGFLSALATNPRIRIIRQARRLSMADNWNECLSSARGRHFLLLSDDDALGPDALPRLIDALERNHNAGYCATRTRIVDSDGRPIWTTQTHPVIEGAEDCAKQFLRRRRVFYPCSILFRTDDLRAVGGFDSAFGPAADVAAWLRCGHHRGAVAFVGDTYCDYREHSNSQTAATAIHEWQRRIDAIGTLIESLYGANRGTRRDIERLGNYMAMDFAVKAALASGRGVAHAIYLAASYSDGDWLGFARIAAKTGYYGARRALLVS